MTQTPVWPEDLLRPISEDSPCGELMRNSPLFNELQSARKHDNDLPVGVWRTERKQIDFEKVIHLCGEILVQRSKDLLVAAWLTEAVVWRDGPQALAQSLAALEALLQSFSDAIHPLPDEDIGQNPRTLIFEWLDERLSVLLATWPLTAPFGPEARRYRLDDYRHGLRLEGRAPASHAGKMSGLREFRAATTATPASTLRAMAHATAQALNSLMILKERLDQQLSDEAPSLSATRDALQQVQHWAASELEVRGVMDSDQEAIAPENDPAGFDADHHDRMLHPIAGRREAYRSLAQIADYLSRLEPHSPTPYLLARIVEWQDMTLPDLLVELGRGRRDIAAVFELLGYVEGKN